MRALRVELARAPWWQWALLSVGSSLFVLALSIASLIFLLMRGVDMLDYIVLARPPYITDGAVAAAIAVLLGAQTLGSALALALFAPARAVAFAGLRRPSDPGGLARRLLGGLVFLIALQVVWEAVGPRPAEHWRVVEHFVYAVARGCKLTPEGPWPAVWLILSVGLVVPVAEEVLFRGLVYGLLRRRFSLWPAALLSALAFGLPHGPAGALPAAAMGLWFAYQAEHDRTLAGAMTLHALNNLGAMVVMFAQLTESCIH